MSEPSDLDRLLAAAATAPGEKQASERFVAAMLVSDVTWLLGPADDGAMNPITVTRDGRPMVPFFSSPQRLADVLPSLAGREFVPARISGRELFSEAVRNSIATVLNPASSYGKVFLPLEMSELLMAAVLAAGEAEPAPGD